MFEEDGFASLDAAGGLELAMDEAQLLTLRGQEGEVWSAERVREAMGLEPGEGPFVGGIFHPTACSFCPSRAVRALARAAIAAGVNLQTHTTATKVVDGMGGEDAVVETDRGSIKTRKGVIVCANAWSGRIVPELEALIRPARDHVIVTEPVDKVWKHSFCCPESAGVEAGDDFWYGIQMPDGRVCLGGGRRLEHGGYAWEEDDDSSVDPRVILQQHFILLTDLFTTLTC